jgi:hypothetical protein
VIIPPILICERRLGDPRVTFIPTQSIYERAPVVDPQVKFLQKIFQCPKFNRVGTRAI